MISPSRLLAGGGRGADPHPTPPPHERGRELLATSFFARTGWIWLQLHPSQSAGSTATRPLPSRRSMPLSVSTSRSGETSTNTATLRGRVRQSSTA
jgi:hypothetical protein